MTGNPTNAMVCGTRYLQNEFGDPRFFYIFNLVLSFSTCSQSFNKICVREVLGANVLKCIALTSFFVVTIIIIIMSDNSNSNNNNNNNSNNNNNNNNNNKNNNNNNNNNYNDKIIIIVLLLF